MANWYVDSGAGVVEYSNKAWSVGEFMVPTVADTTTNHLVAKQWVWECTTGGTSTATPTWPASVTDDVTTVTDSGVVWTARAPDNWTHAMPGLYWIAADATTNRAEPGDRVYVKNTHAWTYNQSTTVAFPGSKTADFVYIQSVDSSLVPTAGGMERMGTGYNYVIAGKIWVNGIEFRGGVGGASGNYITFGASNIMAWVTLDGCTIKFNNTTTDNSHVFLSSGYTAGDVTLKNCTFDHTQAGQAVRWSMNGHTVIGLNAIYPINFVQGGVIRDSNFPAGTGCGFGFQGYWGFLRVTNCKIASGTFGGPNPTNMNPGQFLEVINCTSGDSTQYYYYQDYVGAVQASKTIYLSSGGSAFKEQDGSLTPYSMEVNPTAQAIKAHPAYSPWVSVYVDQTGDRAISMKVAYDAATALTDSELFLEVEYFSEAGNSMSIVGHTAPVIGSTTTRDPFAAGSTLFDTNEAWTGTGGWTNKKTHTLTKVVNVQQQGFLRARIGLAKDVTVYVDNKVLIG